MEISWKWSSLYLCLLLFQLCNGRPINSENTLTDQQTKFLTGIVSILLTVCGLVLLAGCLCCRRGHSFREFRNSPVAVSISSQLDHGHVNPIANGEFTIFTPLSPPHFNNNIFLASDQIKHTRTLESDVEDGLIKSWFSSTEKDFPRIKLKYIRELGKGWFGKVVEGAAQDINNEGHVWAPVVVRILDASSSQKEKNLFLQDAAIYKCGNHGNILTLIGRCLDTVPYLLLQEYCPQGDLKGYLRSKKPSAESFLATEYPLLWCCQLTSALKHLHDNHVLHPDLASRNCQLTTNLTLKLGDYGLGVFKYPNDYYQGSPGVPVRWSAPESLTYTQTTIQPKQVSREGNVWALGVTMWEICECGEQPYSSLSDDEVISQVLGPANVRLARPRCSVLYTDYMFRLMQLCWTNAESRPTLTQINLMLSDLLQVHRNTNSNAPQSLLSADDFDERWESFKPNSIVKTDHVSDSVSIEMHFPETTIRKSLSASLHNLHGSLEDLLKENDDSHVMFVEDELRNVGFSSANDESLTSERIFTSDSSDQESTANKPESKSKIGFENSFFDSKLFQRSSSGSETEDENWRNKVERGAYTEKVRLKSRSVADLMVLTHVDYSESEPETPLPSLDYKVNNYKNVRLAPSNNLESGNLTFGSEGNLLSIKDTFQEELKKLQEERKDSLLFVPDNLSHSSFRVDENVVDNLGSSQSIVNSSSVTNSSRLIHELNSPTEIKPAGQVFNVFNVTIDKYSPLDVNTKLTEIINFDKAPDIRSKSEQRNIEASARLIRMPEYSYEYELCDKVENISSEEPCMDTSVMEDTELNPQLDVIRNGSGSSEDDELNGFRQKLPNSCYQNETELNLVDSLEDDMNIMCNDNDSSYVPINDFMPESSMGCLNPLDTNTDMPLENGVGCDTFRNPVGSDNELIDSTQNNVEDFDTGDINQTEHQYVGHTEKLVISTDTEEQRTAVQDVKNSTEDVDHKNEVEETCSLYERNECDRNVAEVSTLRKIDYSENPTTLDTEEQSESEENLVEISNTGINKLEALDIMDEIEEGSNNIVQVCNEYVHLNPKELLSTDAEPSETGEHFVDTCNENVDYKLKEVEEIHALSERNESNRSIKEIFNEYVDRNQTKQTANVEKLDIEKPSEIAGEIVDTCNENVDYKLKEVTEVYYLDERNEDNENTAEAFNDYINPNQTKTLEKSDDCAEKPESIIAEPRETVENVETCNENVLYKMKEIEEIHALDEMNDKTNQTKPLEKGVDYAEKPDSITAEPRETVKNVVESCNENVLYKIKEVEEMHALDEINKDETNIVEACNEYVDLKQSKQSNENSENTEEPGRIFTIAEPFETVGSLVEICNETVDYKLNEVDGDRQTLDIISSNDVNFVEISNERQIEKLIKNPDEVSGNVNENREICMSPGHTNVTYIETKHCESHLLNSEGSCDKDDNTNTNTDLETKCVNFDLSVNQEEAMPNSLTHSIVFASTPFRKREISLPVEDTFSSINLFGVPKENDILDADFSLEFSQLENFPTNKSLNYSLETWDNFLGTTLDHQKSMNDNLFDSFSSEPKSLLFVDNEEKNSGKDETKVLLNQTVVIPENGKEASENETEVQFQAEQNATYVMDDKTEKTFVIDEKPTTSDAANSTFVKESSTPDDPNGGSWENGGGWFLHPQTTNDDLSGEMQIQNSQTESYVGFGIDDEIMSAIRNELLSKLPHAQGATAERTRDDDEWESSERNEVFLRYNVYNTPLSPIPEESYVEEHSGMEYLKQERENEDSDWSDRCLSETLAPDTESPSAQTLESNFRGPHHRHTPSQDSCCSNDTLFNLEELNYGTTEPEKHDDSNTEHSEAESNNNVTGNSEKTFIVEQEALNKISEPPNIAIFSSNSDFEVYDVHSEKTTNDSVGVNLINDFLVEERKHSLENFICPERLNLTLNISQSDSTKTHNVPLPSPEDNPWKQLPASQLSFDKFKSLNPSIVLESEEAKGVVRNSCTQNVRASEKNTDEAFVEAIHGEPRDDTDEPNIVVECAKIVEQILSDELFREMEMEPKLTKESTGEQPHNKNHEVESTEQLNVPEYVNILENDFSEKPIPDSKQMLTQKEFSDETPCRGNCEVESDERHSMVDEKISDLSLPQNEELLEKNVEQLYRPEYVNIVGLESTVETEESILPLVEVPEEEHHYENCGLVPEYVNISDKEACNKPLLGCESELPQEDEESAYANCEVAGSDRLSENIDDKDVDSTNTEDIYESINDETDPYEDYVNIVNMENTKNSLEYENSDKDNEYMDILRQNESDVNSDNDSNIFGMLTDIRFSGPSDSQLMSTSFSENNGDEQEWDSGSDSRSSSSGEFIWKEGEHEESLKALTAAPQDLMENTKPLEGIAEDAYEESDISSTTDEEGETPEFVPSAWDKYARPGKSVLRSPEKILNKSEEKKPKGVWFKKQKYHCIYEYPKEPESPVLQSQDLWKPQPDFKSFTDWEFDGEPFLPHAIDDNEPFSTYSNQTNRISNSQNLYQLTSIPDLIPDEVDDGKSQEFFISGSTQPFHCHNSSSQFFPGSSSWTMESATPDSGVEDITPGNLIDNKYSMPVGYLPSLKQLASDAVNQRKHLHFRSKDILGGMRHTRNKLKLDLPPSPSAFSPEKMFLIEPAPEPVVVREKPTFTTFGKSRFLVQHVDTPPDDSKIRNVSFEALPYKPPLHPDSPQNEPQNESDRFILKNESLEVPIEKSIVKDEHSNLCHTKIEVVKGEASVLDSGDEDSGIESSTLERKVVKNAET